MGMFINFQDVKSMYLESLVVTVWASGIGFRVVKGFRIWGVERGRGLFSFHRDRRYTIGFVHSST